MCRSFDALQRYMLQKCCVLQLTLARWRDTLHIQDSDTGYQFWISFFLQPALRGACCESEYEASFGFRRRG